MWCWYIHNQFPAWKEPLLTNYCTTRMDFCLQYLPGNHRFWGVIWMDEKLFSTDQDERISLWWPNNTCYSPQHLVNRIENSMISMAFWGLDVRELWGFYLYELQRIYWGAGESHASYSANTKPPRQDVYNTCHPC